MRNRWVILGAGCAIQVVLGGIYAWSTFVPHLVQPYDLSAAQCGFIFGLTILSFTTAMILAGWVLTHRGPRVTALISAVLFAAGYLVAAASAGSFAVLLLGLGVVVGAGIGFGYVCPLSVGMKWFPEKKGLVTGVAVAGFGGGAILLASVAEYWLLHGADVLLFFRWYGVCAGVVLALAASLLADPPHELTVTSKAHALSGVLTQSFGLVCAGIFCGTFAGLLIVGNLAPLVIKAGMSEGEAAVAVSVFAVGNALGRIGWGHAFDYIGYKSIPLSLGGFAVVAAALLLPIPAWLLFLVVGLLGVCFGANFVIYASTISRCFGTASFARLYPICFMAYGIAGLIGPGLGGYLADRTGAYGTAIIICVAMLIVAAAVTALKLAAFISVEAGD